MEALAPLALRDVIKEVTRSHLTESGGLLFGQCLTAVGWVGGTIPELYENDGLVELSMADVSGGGIVVGAGLAQRRPIYVIRYQGFNWFNAPIIINYAAKSKEMWGIPCPIFIRSIAMEGAIGPVAGSSHASLYYRMPGIKIFSPMTASEYRECYRQFMIDDDVYYVSEHRGSFGCSEELDDEPSASEKFSIVAISITRFEARKAVKILKERHGISVNLINLWKIKPLEFSDKAKCALANANKVLVVDDDYVDGISKSIAFDIQKLYGPSVDVLGLKPVSAGFAKEKDNLPPSAEDIVNHVLGQIL